MASYYPSFTYMGYNSLTDKHLKVVAFDADSGEKDSFLGMESVYTEKYDGTRRIDYGAKFSSVAIIKISVVKFDGTDFTVAEVRDFLKWTTGARQVSYLDLMSGNTVKFSFLGRVVNAYQQKMDSRTIGLSIEFESVSPWAYSPIQRDGYNSSQSLDVSASGLLDIEGTSSAFKVDANGVLSGDTVLKLSDDGVTYINSSKNFQVNNKTDDLYTPIYLNVKITSNSASNISIKNTTLDEETIINNVAANEEVTLSDKQFITSDNGARIFGNDFNFKWPRLAPGINNFEISMAGNGSVEFTYRYPIKIGDCAIDMNDLISYCEGFSDNPTFDTESIPSEGVVVQGDVYWNMIRNTPTTISGYGITDAYTTTQIDDKLSTLDLSDNIDESTLGSMLDNILGE